MNKNIKLLLIGKNSFISTNLHSFLKNKIFVKKVSFESFKVMNLNDLKKYTHVCNCSITKNYCSYNYNKNHDLDLEIVKKIKNLNLKFIFLSSRKVYKPAPNIKETSKIKPIDTYSKNKFITEKEIKKYMKKKHIILRISNVIGVKYNKKKYRKISSTFIDNYYKFKKIKKKVFYKDEYKDFLTIEQFKIIFLKILKFDLIGTYNFSLGEKVYVSEILNALNKYKNTKKFVKINSKNNNSFYLNNKKLLNKIKFELKKKDLLRYCYKI